MARTLRFDFQGVQFDMAINRVDRSKLYGSTDIKTLDPDGQVCSLATLAGDGKTLIGSGGTAIGYLGSQGQWLERSDLNPVNANKEPLPSVESSFKVTTELDAESSVEHYLNHSIRLCYLLHAEDPIPSALIDELTAGKIYQFQFSYRGGVDPDTAFLLLGEAGKPWLMVAEHSDIEPVGLEQAALCGANRDGEEDELDGDESLDPLDFGAL